jgi:hypothetical protein
MTGNFNFDMTVNIKKKVIQKKIVVIEKKYLSIMKSRNIFCIAKFLS